MVDTTKVYRDEDRLTPENAALVMIDHQTGLLSACRDISNEQEEINMHREQLAKGLLVVAALSTLIVPVVTDAILLADAHMNNPAWLPHAKLHCAMSFFAAISLGVAALAILKVCPVSDRFSMGLAAFLGSAFWIGLIASGFWSGTSYGFLNDPVFGNIREPQLGGITIYPNVVASVITIAIAVAGYWLLTSQTRSTDKH